MCGRAELRSHYRGEWQAGWLAASPGVVCVWPESGARAVAVVTKDRQLAMEHVQQQPKGPCGRKLCSPQGCGAGSRAGRRALPMAGGFVQAPPLMQRGSASASASCAAATAPQFAETLTNCQHPYALQRCTPSGSGSTCHAYGATCAAGLECITSTQECYAGPRWGATCAAGLRASQGMPPEVLCCAVPTWESHST